MALSSDFGELVLPQTPLHLLALEQFSQYGDAPALVEASTGRTYTFRELARLVKSVSCGLVKCGVQRGDVVAIYSPNCPNWVVLYWAILASGAVVTTVNPLYTKYELLHQVKDCGARFICTVSDLLPHCEHVKQELSQIQDIIVLDDCSDQSCVHFDTLACDDAATWPVLQQAGFNLQEDLALIIYSSGTTGLPKGVMLTHRNLLANVFQLLHPDMRRDDKEDDGLNHTRVETDPQSTQTCSPENTSDNTIDNTSQGTSNSTSQSTSTSTSQSTTLVVLPFYHAYGIVPIICCSLLGGVRLVILAKFEPRTFLGAIEKYKVTTLPLVPSLATFLAKSPLVAEFDLTSVKGVGCGAAPLSQEVAGGLKEKLEVEDMTQGYGMTEACCVICAYSDNTPERPGSCGKLLPATELKIVCVETKTLLGPNEKGEIWVRGPQVMKGYLGQPGATQEVLDSERWLRSGDIGYYDEDHYVFVVDRLKELIKVKGFQVAPAELEALLLGHPAVVDAGVVGVADEKAGELPRAFVVREEGSSLTEQQLYDYAAERTAPYKHLKGGVHFIGEIPRLMSGKILRRKLKEMNK